jgi:hypothetical protein
MHEKRAAEERSAWAEGWNSADQPEIAHWHGASSRHRGSPEGKKGQLGEEICQTVSSEAQNNIENGDKEVDSWSEALSNQIKQLQNEVARLSEAGANRGQGPSGIIVSSDVVPEGADKPGEVPVQENV